MTNHLWMIGVLALCACSKEEPEVREVPRAADNTANNRGDERAQAVTPTDQRENAADLDLTQKIRQGIVADDSLSFSAKNAKVVAQNGRVTLRGAVESEQERAAIGAIASRVAGSEAVSNQLEVTK